MTNLPPRRKLIHLLGVNDFFFREYYGKGIFGKIQAWIFRSRIKEIMEFMRCVQLKPKMVLDVGCGPMFISYPLEMYANCEYIGVDSMSIKRLKMYQDAMRKVGVKSIVVVRASAESLPFRNESFNLALSLDVLEHLSKPKETAMEIYRVVKNRGVIAISLPLENMFHRLSRIGKILIGDQKVSIMRTPEYHYVGDIKTYVGMVKMLKGLFNLMYTRFTPIGFNESINVNAIHILQKK